MTFPFLPPFLGNFSIGSPGSPSGPPPGPRPPLDPTAAVPGGRCAPSADPGPAGWTPVPAGKSHQLCHDVMGLVEAWYPLVI